MRLIILIFFSISISVNCEGQNAYYDALFCGKLLPEDADINSLGSISVLTNGDETILAQFKNFLEDPFKYPKPNMDRIRQIYRKIEFAQKSNVFAQGFGGSQVVSLLGSLAGLSDLSSLNTDTLLYGLTVHTADEFRNGYVQTYMRTVKKSIEGFGELKILFPVTYQKVLTYDPLRYKEFGTEMKKSFDSDLSLSLYHLRKYIATENPNTQGRFLTAKATKKIRENEKIYTYFNLACEIGDRTINGTHPTQTISILNELVYGSSFYDENIADAIHLIDIIQRNLRDTSSTTNAINNAWITHEKFQKVMNPKSLKYFLANVYHQDSVFFSKEKYSFSSADHKELLRKIKIQELLSVLSSIDNIRLLKGSAIFDENNFKMYFDQISSLIGVIESIAKDNSQLSENSQELTTEIFEIYNQIRVKNFSNLVPHFVRIITLLQPVDFPKTDEDESLQEKILFLEKKLDQISLLKSLLLEFEKYKMGDFINFTKGINIITSLNLSNTEDSLLVGEVLCQLKEINLENVGKPSKPDLSTFYPVLVKNKMKINERIQELNTKLKLLDLPTFYRELDKLNSFTSGIISANTSEEISNVLKKYSDSPSSYYGKRIDREHISLGSMPGLFGAREVLDNDKVGANFGLSLPIGIDLSCGVETWGKKSSFSLFTQIIDLGAMLNYRLATESNFLPDKVGWEAVLSPGIAATWGLPNTPWNIQLGFQRNPRLRKIDKNNSEIEPVASNKWQLRFSYDIPLKKLW